MSSLATYDFKCPPCGATKTLRQPMSADLPAEVPCECGETAQRVYSPPSAIIFRGGGFYSTDVKGRNERRRRPNAGDDLYREHDATADLIARRS